MKLWFENHLGIERQIADCDTWQDVCKMIKAFIDQCNEGRASNKHFKSYYMRTWQTPDGRTKIDVGSHTEFFYWEGQIKNIEIMDNGEAVMK